MALDRWTRLQTSPFGSSSALRSGPVGGSSGSQFRRLGESYGRALRLLDREARRGDARSALSAIKLREDAIEQGVQTGGIRRKSEYDSGILGRVEAMEQGAIDRERAAQANRQVVDEALAEGTDPSPEVTDAAQAPNARVNAALDIMEADRTDNDSLMQRGLDSARSQGVEDPVSVLRGDPNLRFRRTLDTALGQARTPGEIATLRERGARYGIATADFDRRANWWERNRKI